MTAGHHGGRRRSLDGRGGTPRAGAREPGACGPPSRDRRALCRPAAHLARASSRATHRHTAAALRFIVEGENTYTAVAGERCYMRPGDFIVTPSWTWHEHRNEGREPTIWLDVLDVPLIRFLGAGFSEHYPEPTYPDRRPTRRQPFPLRAQSAARRLSARPGASPVFAYPFDYAYEALEHLRAHSDWDACHGVKMEYIDPTTGGPAIPTISTFLQLLPQGFATAPYRATASSVVTVVRGRGRVTIGGGAEPQHVRVWAEGSPGPCRAGSRSALPPREESVLFCASDEAVHRKLGVWREQRG